MEFLKLDKEKNENSDLKLDCMSFSGKGITWSIQLSTLKQIQEHYKVKELKNLLRETRVFIAEEKGGEHYIFKESDK